jgi:hypothetical protein
MKHPKQSLYPSYDVLTEKENWDKNTQEVIKERISPSHLPFFTPEEKEILCAMIPILFPSHLGELSIDVISIFENRFANRKIIGFPKGSKIEKVIIIRQGLKLLSEQIFVQYETVFSKLEKEQQKEVLKKLEENQGYLNIWQEINPRLFFTTLVKELISIVYSDPSIWSAIGYGGPAYPRGYYSFGKDQFDPWEAKINVEEES